MGPRGRRMVVVKELWVVGKVICRIVFPIYIMEVIFLIFKKLVFKKIFPKFLPNQT